MNNARSHLSQAAPRLRHVFTMLGIDLGTSPGASFVNGENEATHQAAKTEFRFSEHVDITYAGTFVIYCLCHFL